MVCDICDTPGKGTIVSVSDFKKAVRNGFNPIKSKLHSHSVWTYELWKENALTGVSSHTDWNICSNCMNVLRPYIEGATSTEGQNSTDSSKEGCYIATTCYGSYNAPQVFVFRKYRDDVLAKSTIGTIIIKIYYKFSPFWADKLKNHLHLNKLIRIIFLDTFYKMLHILKKY
ncbi:MAG: CFI-box-CTERM domain-containing protein [Lentimicrobium sp.]